MFQLLLPLLKQKNMLMELYITGPSWIKNDFQAQGKVKMFTIALVAQE